MANKGSFKRGDPRTGRKPGSANKIPQALKDMILQSLSEVGGVSYLVAQSSKNPTAYLALIGKVLPLQVKQDGNEPMVPAVVIHEHRDD